MNTLLSSYLACHLKRTEDTHEAREGNRRDVRQSWGKRRRATHLPLGRYEVPLNIIPDFAPNSQFSLTCTCRRTVETFLGPVPWPWEAVCIVIPELD